LNPGFLSAGQTIIGTTVVGIGRPLPKSRREYLFNNNLAFLWPQSVIDRIAPDSPPKTKVGRESGIAPMPEPHEKKTETREIRSIRGIRVDKVVSART
jgi:hypothetical protein